MPNSLTKLPVRTALFGIFLMAVTVLVLLFDRCAPRPEQEQERAGPFALGNPLQDAIGQPQTASARLLEMASRLLPSDAGDPPVMEVQRLWQTGLAEHPWVISNDWMVQRGTGWQRAGGYLHRADGILVEHLSGNGKDSAGEWLATISGQPLEPMRSGQRISILPLREISLAAYEQKLAMLREEAASAGIPLRFGRDILLSPASPTPNDPIYPQQWSLQVSNASAAWAITVGSQDIVVGVIDSGIDVDHPDFLHLDGGSNLWMHPGEIAGNGLDDDGNGFVDDVSGWDFEQNDNTLQAGTPHGPRMAGIIGAAGHNQLGITGVSQRVSLLPLKVGGLLFATSAIIQAIDYAIHMREAGHPVHILSNSYGTLMLRSQLDEAEPLRAAVERATAAGILFVAASGNNARDLDNPLPLDQTFIPAGFTNPDILSVTATQSTDTIWSYANFGPTSVDLGAPGAFLYSTTLGGTHNTGSGTSEACAFAAGAAALVLAAYPDLDAAALKRILMVSGTPLPDLTSKTVSGRRIHLGEAINEALRYPVIDWAANPPKKIQANWPQALYLEIQENHDPIAVTTFTSDKGDGPFNAIGGTTFSTEVLASELGSAQWFAEVQDTGGRRIRSRPLPITALDSSSYWLSRHYGRDFLPPASSSFWTDVTTVSGTPPIVAFLRGWSPHLPAPADATEGAPELLRYPSADGNSLIIEFPISARADALNWQLQVSSDLIQWTAIPHSQIDLISTAADNATLRLRATTPLPASGSLFHRFAVDWK